jgi:hypothetical protein
MGASAPLPPGEGALSARPEGRVRERAGKGAVQEKGFFWPGAVWSNEVQRETSYSCSYRFPGHRHPAEYVTIESYNDLPGRFEND